MLASLSVVSGSVRKIDIKVEVGVRTAEIEIDRPEQ